MKELIEKEKWYPMIHPTNFEMKCASMLNDFLESLKDMTEDEVMTTLKVFKYPMINIALYLNKEL